MRTLVIASIRETRRTVAALIRRNDQLGRATEGHKRFESVGAGTHLAAADEALRLALAAFGVDSE